MYKYHVLKLNMDVVYDKILKTNLLLYLKYSCQKHVLILYMMVLVLYEIILILELMFLFP